MTLIEITIATAVIMVVFVLAMGTIISVSTTSAVSEDQAMAATQVASVMEELRSMPSEELLSYQPPTAEELPAGTGVDVVCFDGDGNAFELPLTGEAGALPNPTEIQVTVFWQDKMGRTYSTRSSAMFGR
jgi:hypothetical protein